MVADPRRHGGAMTLEDLAAHSADWVGALSQAYAGAVVDELPPNGQGIATLIGLTILETLVTGGRGVDDPQTVHLGYRGDEVGHG
jgi:gamma-glutamyltranspeptidase/glutathione hydrolase